VVKPKPMVEIGGKPILWHIMKIYSHWGFNDFVVCLGYKGYMIKEFFANYLIHQSDVTIDLRTNTSLIHSNNSEPWRITLVDTGDKTMTGGRILRVKEYLGNETFMLTYGDGVADIELQDFWPSTRATEACDGHRREASFQFGGMTISDGRVTDFIEKPQIGEGWINVAFSCCSLTSSIISAETRCPLSGSPSKGWRGTPNWRRTSMTASGSAWTR